MSPLAARVARIEPFHVMEVVKQAAALERGGRSVIHLSIGEPDFTATEPVQRAAADAIAQAKTQYTPALGLNPLRERIAEWYATHHGVVVDPAAIAVTAGASAALLLTCAALVERDSEVLLPDPSYPCNRHFIAAFDGRPRLLPTGPQQRFQLEAAQVEHHWGAATRGVLIASPSNPTGTSIEGGELRRLIAAVEARGGFVVSDEIYLGLSYDGIASGRQATWTRSRICLIAASSRRPSRYFATTSTTTLTTSARRWPSSGFSGGLDESTRPRNGSGKWKRTGPSRRTKNTGGRPVGSCAATPLPSPPAGGPSFPW